MNSIKKLSFTVLVDNVRERKIYYYSTLDRKVEVSEIEKDVYRIIIGYHVDPNIDEGEHIEKRGTLKEMLKEGEKLYKLILKNENIYNYRS